MLQDRKYTVCRRIRASFSPEILQVGAVRGIKSTAFGVPKLRVKKLASDGLNDKVSG